MLSSVGNQIGLFYGRRRAQDDLDRFFTLSLDLLCVVGFDGYFKRVNPAWQRVLGYTSQELLARPFIEFIHPDDRQASIARSVESLDRGGAASLRESLSSQGRNHPLAVVDGDAVP